jgi:hypothetical protein
LIRKSVLAAEGVAVVMDKTSDIGRQNFQSAAGGAFPVAGVFLAMALIAKGRHPLILQKACMMVGAIKSRFT